MKTSTFQTIAARVTTVVEFDPTLANGTGYYDFAVNHDFGLAIGESCKFVDSSNRTVLVHATFYGNVVAFERYKPQDGQEFTHVVGNVPSALRDLLPGSEWSEDDLGELIGMPGNNSLGEKLRWLMKATLIRVNNARQLQDDARIDTDLSDLTRPVFISRGVVAKAVTD